MARWPLDGWRESMNDIVFEVVDRSFGTISLGRLLAGLDTQFRGAIIGALIHDGFELDDPVPSLQHPGEVLNALQWLESHGYGASWQAFCRCLEEAGRLGILLDVSLRRIRFADDQLSHPSFALAVARPLTA
jgi:hypothetical protein